MFEKLADTREAKKEEKRFKYINKWKVKEMKRRGSKTKQGWSKDARGKARKMMENKIYKKKNKGFR